MGDLHWLRHFHIRCFACSPLEEQGSGYQEPVPPAPTIVLEACTAQEVLRLVTTEENRVQVLFLLGNLPGSEAVEWPFLTEGEGGLELPRSSAYFPVVLMSPPALKGTPPHPNR